MGMRDGFEDANSRYGRLGRTVCTECFCSLGVGTGRRITFRSSVCYRADTHLAGGLQVACWHGAPLGACKKFDPREG
jgi:hypothetical protein